MKIKSLNELAHLRTYLGRINAEPRSLRTAVVKEISGRYWEDIATIKIEQDGTITAPAGYEPTPEEAERIKAECLSVTWPTQKKIHGIPTLPEALRKVDEEDLFYFRDENGLLTLIQQRIELKNDSGEKRYVPWTFWDDNEWRTMEPDGALPLWGLENIKDHSTVFIHEGAKAARACQRMVAGQTPKDKEDLKAHPWGYELSAGIHLGWIGGALSPTRTDWSVLRRLGVNRAYIVSDNDDAGKSSVPAIAFRLHMPTFAIQFTGEWPATFDLADPFPAEMFRQIGSARYYVGPAFRSCCHPATWMTDQIPVQGRGRPITVMRKHAKEMWAYVEEVDMFVCKEMPEILRGDNVLNKMLAPFSHVNNTSTLLAKAQRGRMTKLCYRPDIEARLVTDETTSAINLHTSTTIKPIPGDEGPWLEFLDYMFINPEERPNVMKWCATLIARPDVRMEYGLLLVSEMQGVGKTTLGARILAPLVGMQNASFPSEEDIVGSPFNHWVANKRLIIIGEIYSGHSWKAYNKLKAYITDKTIQVNQKFMRPHQIENWAHIVASSNSRKALKMEEDDRRWYYPKVTEEHWPREKFAQFYGWLEAGGLSIIHNWAKNYGEYVQSGDRAPMTELKKHMISESRSEAEQMLVDFCEALIESNAEVCLPIKAVRAWLVREVGRFFDTDHELKKAVKSLGFKVYGERLVVDGYMQNVIMSPAFCKANAELLKPSTDNDVRKQQREAIVLAARDAIKM